LEHFIIAITFEEWNSSVAQIIASFINRYFERAGLWISIKQHWYRMIQHLKHYQYKYHNQSLKQQRRLLVIYVIHHHHLLHHHRLEKRSRSKLFYHFFVLMENDVEENKKRRILMGIFSNLFVQLNSFLYVKLVSIQSLLNISCLFEINYNK